MSDVFVSCSADWSVKLWHQEHTSPLHSFSSAKVGHIMLIGVLVYTAHCGTYTATHTYLQTPVYDVVWSPFHSAMFGCVSDDSVEVWSLDINM